jgi:DNA-binding NtrC family response regulator
MEHARAILVIDGNAAVAQDISRELSGHGWQVDVAHDRDSALRAVEEKNFDAVVLDPRIPEPERASLIEHLSRRSPSQVPPVAIVLSEGDGVSASAAQAASSEGLEGPATAARLDEQLRAAFRRRDSLAPWGEGDPVDRILGETPAIRAVREQIRSVARFPGLSVLIVGEAGTGKELAAQAIHVLSKSEGPFVPVNCAAIPEQLMESELFGQEAGAFAPGRSAHPGILESVDVGTLFIDELGEIPAQLQPRLLRVLETRTFRRIGGGRDLSFCARVISATNRRLSGPDAVVRSDLYFRLAGFTILMPALRERAEDIELLAQKFLADFRERYPEAPSTLASSALEALRGYEWPGNVRELRSVVQQAAVLSRGDSVGADEVVRVVRERRAEAEFGSSNASSQQRLIAAVPVGEPLRVVERRMIEGAWQASGHNLSAAARTLGLPRTTLRDKLRKYGLL